MQSNNAETSLNSRVTDASILGLWVIQKRWRLGLVANNQTMFSCISGVLQYLINEFSTNLFRLDIRMLFVYLGSPLVSRK